MKNKKAPMLIGEDLLPDIDNIPFSKETNRLQSQMTHMDQKDPAEDINSSTHYMRDSEQSQLFSTNEIDIDRQNKVYTSQSHNYRGPNI